ncbi:EamA family transporter RarD [Bacillus sp. FJAT-45350]|uniref:EamA family transporter RarD n=1 Tax=Bacillus sp. FJAT-45350 TaxID=2011014 RepID=UPI000BB8160B|nr:EamA family transporter RarD [Bacillus sp. FJAT-45350]
MFAIGAYITWGFLPLFWKLLDHVPTEEILAHRVIWSFVFMLMIIGVLGKSKTFVTEVKELMKQRKKLISIILASVLISINWFLFIWSVNNDLVIQTSLGYYINPLVSVLLGILILKEKLSFWQTVAVILAAIGVFNMTFQFGSFPWAALALAVTFAFYGLFKKMANVGALTGLTIETFFITPFALIFIGYIWRTSGSSFTFEAPLNIWLLLGAGIATAVPLLLFASGTRRISLSLIGFFQYIAPTIMLVLGIFLFNEPFTTSHLGSFIFIWCALLIFSLGKTKFFVRLEPKFFVRKKSLQG